MPFVPASSVCKMLGAHLPVTETEKEHIELNAELRNIPAVSQNQFWFGVIAANGSYIWQPTGKDLSNGYVKWLSDPSVPPFAGKICSFMQIGSVAMDFCHKSFNVICEHDMK